MINETWAGFKGGCDWLEKTAIVMTAVSLVISFFSLNVIGLVLSIPVAVALVRLARLRGQALGAGPMQPGQVHGPETGTIAPPPPVRQDEPPEGGWY